MKGNGRRDRKRKEKGAGKGKERKEKCTKEFIEILIRRRKGWVKLSSR